MNVLSCYDLAGGAARGTLETAGQDATRWSRTRRTDIGRLCPEHTVGLSRHPQARIIGHAIVMVADAIIVRRCRMEHVKTVREKLRTVIRQGPLKVMMKLPAKPPPPAIVNRTVKMPRVGRTLNKVEETPDRRRDRAPDGDRLEQSLGTTATRP